VSATGTSAAIVVPQPPPPAIGDARESHVRWREAGTRRRAGHAKRVPVGTRFEFTLSAPAQVTLAFARRVSFTSRRGSCVSGHVAVARHVRCERTVQAGAFTYSGHAGTNTVAFAGRIARRPRLAPGLYAVTIGATNVWGAATPRTLSFRIVR
jgi:hypothetical protein